MPITSMAVDPLEQRLSALESKVAAMEKAISEKLEDCQMTYVFHTYRLNRCDENTFVRSVTPVGNGVNQLECGYYQLRCSRTR